MAISIWMRWSVGILANLIFKRYIRGYLSHEKRRLVLSKKEPFPTSKVNNKLNGY
jgi:hypothetical protein